MRELCRGVSVKEYIFSFPEVLVLWSEGIRLRNVEGYELCFNVSVLCKNSTHERREYLCGHAQ